jgi:hypothetical protein
MVMGLFINFWIKSSVSTAVATPNKISQSTLTPCNQMETIPAGIKAIITSNIILDVVSFAFKWGDDETVNKLIYKPSKNLYFLIFYAISSALDAF